MTPLAHIVVIALLLAVGAAEAQTTVTLTPVADASIDFVFGNMNLGSQPTLEVGYLSSRQVRRALIRFNLVTGVPAEAVIDSAQLKLYLQGTDGADPASFLAVLVAEDWVESLVTWNNQPNRDQPTVGVTMNGVPGYKNVDVTDIVRAWHNVPHYGLELRGPEGDPVYWRVFSSRENAVTPPQLLVTYHLPAPPTSTRTPTRTVTPIPTLTPGNCVELLINGDFESGGLAHWQPSGNARLAAGRNSATGVVLLGENNAIDAVAQDVGIPSSATLARLDFWWLATGTVDQPNDILIAFALHQTGATELKTVHAVAPFGQWQHETLDVTSYAGRLVGIDFTAYSDTAQPSSFVLDDVSLTACGVPTPTATPTSPPTATATTTPTPTSTPTASPTSTATPSRTPSPTLTGAATSTATRSATTTAPPARTASPTASATPATPTSTPACPVQLGLWINYDGRIPNFPGSPITASAIDGQERVWIGTDGKGIAVFDGVVWQNYTVASTGRGLVSDFVRTIAADGDEIWVGSTAGVSRFNTATNTWTTYTAANSGLPNNIVSAVAFADVGTPPNRTRAQFIATNGGLAQHYYSGGSERWSVVTAANSALLDNRVHDVAVDSSGAFWIVTAGGANKVEDTVWTSYTDSNTAGCGVIQSATHVSVDDAGGRIWFGTDRAGQIDPQPGVGVCMFDTASGTWRRFQSSNSGLADDTVKGMAVDREGRVWFATDPFYPASPGGVSVCTWSGNTCYWKSYGGSTELGTRRTTSATAGGDRVWFGTVNAGLRSFAPNWGRSLAEDVPALAARSGDVWAGKASGLASLHGTQWTNEFSSKPVQAILPIDATDMWAGTDGDGIFRWTGSAWQTLNSGNSSLTDNSVLALARDMAGRTWIGTNSKGLVVYTPRTGWVTFRAEGSPLPSDHVAALVGDNLGRMWVGTDKGLAMYSGSHWASYGTAQGLPSANVRGLAVSPSGDVWVATAAGTVRSDGIGWVAESPPVPVGEPHAVSVDSSGRVWLAGTTGVAVLDGSRWTTYRARNSGLTNDGAEAVVADANGCVWFGTIQREVTGVMLDGGLLVRGNSPAPLGMPVPTVSGFGPATGKINTVVTIYGSNFDTRGVSYNTVEFRAAGFDHWVPASVVGVGATAIAAKVPIAAMRGPIRVRTGGGTAVSSGNFDPLPTITGLGITSGVAGVPVDIVGANFDSPSATVDVRFGNSGWITNITPLQYDHVRVHVPTDATTGPVQIRTSSGTATSPGPFSVSSAGGLLVFGYDATQGLPCFQCVAGKSMAVRVFVSSASASAPAYVSNALLRVWRAGVPLFTVNAGIADGGVPNQGWFKNTTKQVTRDGSIDFFLPGSKLPASASIYTFEVEIYAGPILLAHQHFGNAHTFEDTYPIRIHAAAPGPAPAGQQLTLLARNLAAVDRAFPVRDGYAQQIGGASTGVQVAIQSYNECDGTAMAHCKGTGYAWDFWQQNSNGQARARIEAHAPPRDLTNDGDKVTLKIGTVGKGKSDGVSLLARLRPDSAFPVGTTTLGASMTIDSPDQSGSPDYWSSGFSFQVNRPAPSGSPVAVAAREPPEPGAGAAATPSLSVRAGRLWREPLSAADTGGVLEPGDVILMEILYANVGSADAKDTVVVLDYDQAHMVVYGTGGLVRGTGNTIETQMIPGLFWAGTGFTGDRVFDWPLDENYNGVIDVNDLSNFVMEFDHWDPVTGNLGLSTDLSKLAPGDVIRNFLDNNRNGRADAGEPVSAYVKRLENLPQLLFTTPTNFTADYNKTHPAQQADVSALWFWGEGRLSSWPGNSWDVNYILGPGQGNASKQFWSDVPPNSAMVHELGHVFGQVKPYSPHATPASHSTNKHVPVPYAYDLVGKRVLTGQQLLNALFPYVASPVEDTFFEPFEYFDMFINLRNQAKAAAAAASAGIAAAGSPSFYISGTVTEDGTAVVSTSYVADDLAPTPSDENSAYVLRFVAGTQPIREHRFPVTFVEVAQDRDLFLHTAAGSFTVMQPFPAETTAIEIWHNTTRLTRIPVSDSAPWVHLLAPNGAESVDGTGDLVVTWDAGDNDGDRLTYAVRYSADRGSTWHTLMAGATATQLRAPLTMLPGSTNALIEVEASDGVHTATDGSDAPFRVSKKPPLSAQIVAPMSNARLVQSQAVTFAGTSFDPEDGLLPDDALVWNSGLDGPLGHGRSLTTLLSAGRHTITLTATDSDGQPAGASATIDVLADFDNDGLADEYEKGNGLEWWNADDGGADSDSDGLSNRGEADWGTDPHNPDDDGDGVSDGDEVAGGSLPTDSSSAPKPAALMASRTRLDLAVTAGGPNPPPTEILLLSSTPQPLDWTATVDAPGLSVRPASGTTPSQVTVTVDVTGLAPGQYDGDLTFRSTTSEQVINVHLEIFTPGLTPTPTPRPTGTLSPRPTPTPTPLGTPAFCPGDCRLDGVVTVDELLKGVNIALGLVDLGVCPVFDTNRDEQVTVNELLQAVNAALGGC